MADQLAPEAPDAMNAALILVADHELNASTFTARVVASTGADTFACVSAALSALSGGHHGGACDRIEHLLDRIGTADQAPAVLAGMLQRSESVPGFGHPLYPDGDPRGQALLERVPATTGPRLQAARALVEAAEHLDLPPPTIDLALVTLAASLGRPPGTAAGWFAVGRSAGWIAHIQEQRALGSTVRPRARYIGT